MTVRTSVIYLANTIVILALAVCYLELLKFIIAKGVAIIKLPEPWSNPMKMAFTGTAAFFSCAGIFIFNRFVTRQNMRHVGYASAVVTFVWYYVWRAGEAGILAHIVGVVMTTYSLFAMLAFVGLPLVFGWFLNRVIFMDGFAWVQKSENDGA